MKNFFLLVSLFFTVHSLAFADTKVSAPVPLSKTETTVPVEESDKTVPGSEADQDIPDPFNNGAEDPFQGNTAPGEPILAVPDPILQGLAIGNQKSTAVINGKTYVQGDEARDGIELVEVRKKEADINLGGSMRTIRLMPELKSQKKQAKVASEANNASETNSVPAIFEDANSAISEAKPTGTTEPLPESLAAANKESK